MNENQYEMANIIKNRLERIRHDYEYYSDYPLSEFIARESELNSVAYEMSEVFEHDKTFDRELFMKACGIA